MMPHFLKVALDIEGAASSFISERVASLCNGQPLKRLQLRRTKNMRAEARSLVEDIKRSVGLLRRHL